MRRGLISWSKTELPESVLDGRVARAQAAMAQAKVDALAVYSDPARGAGASWLSAFMPYWNRGVLIVPKSGRPTLFTGMSNRVHGWIKRNANLAEVIYSTNLGGDVGRFVAQATPGAVIAVPDLPAVPGPVIDGLTTSGASVIDGTNLLAGLRASADSSELALFFKTASIAHAALAAGRSSETDAGALIATIDGDARRHGAEEAYVAIAPDLGKSRTLYRLEGDASLGARFAVRLSLAYKSTWVRMTRTFARDAAAADEIAQATDQFVTAVSLLPKTDALAKFPSWLIEGCRSTQPLEAFAGKLLSDGIEIVPGAVVSVQVAVDTPHGAILIGAPVLTGRNGEHASLLVPPLFNE